MREFERSLVAPAVLLSEAAGNVLILGVMHGKSGGPECSEFRVPNSEIRIHPVSRAANRKSEDWCLLAIWYEEGSGDAM